MSLYNELKHRNVFRVALGYIVSCWLLAQVADLVLENIGAPDWVMQTILQSITHVTSRKLDRAIIAVLIIALDERAGSSSFRWDRSTRRARAGLPPLWM